MTTDKTNKIKIGFTHGDINGIGYELILKTFSNQKMIDFCTPIIYGTAKALTYHKKALNVTDFNFHLIKKASHAKPNKINFINIYDEEVKIDFGKTSGDAGKLAYYALKSAVSDLKENTIDALVTCPINKDNIQHKDFKFPGHTEFLANAMQVKSPLMLMVNNLIRIGVVTGHIPISLVSENLSQNLIFDKISVLYQSLQTDFGFRKPRIAVLGLNPHAGDNGLLGKEESEIIIPAITKAEEKGMLVFGPFPADGFFGNSSYKEFDAVLAMYHDQGLIPFKTLGFDSGVNFTAGLPVIRTSPAHGTAYEIAGKGIASVDSFMESIFLAKEIFKNRALMDEFGKNALKLSIADIEKDNAHDDADKELKQEDEE